MWIFFLSLVASFAAGFWIASWRASVLKQSFEERKALYTQMEQQFKGLSAEALHQSNATFLQVAQSTFEKVQQQARGQFESDLVKPVKETLERFDRKMEDLEKARVSAHTSIREQVGMLLEAQRQLKSETGNLVKALRAPVVRGRWGEIQLRRVVELAGMVDHCDFYEQETVTSEERRYRPDLLVRLPGKKNIVVDAKAPLEAYLEAIECQDDEKKSLKLKDHARQIRSHVTLLSRKSYWDQFQPSPEFVVLFLPGETFFSAALEHDPSLIEMGAGQQVILATPTTLIALLRAVAYGWRQESLSANAHAISTLGKELYKRIFDMTSHFSRVGKSLGGAVQAYNKAVGSLESRVLVSARRFKELESTGLDADIEPVEPIEQVPRLLQVAEEIDTISQK